MYFVFHSVISIQAMKEVQKRDKQK